MKVPTKENIEATKRLRGELLSDWIQTDEILYAKFKQLDKNVNHNEVVFKVRLVNGLYNCGLRFDVDDVTELIIGAKIDDGLRTGDPINLVEKIANLRVPKVGNMRRDNLGPVFASKYCHFHVPDRFAIYDRFAKHALENLLERGIQERNYRQFKLGIDELRARIGMPLTYKEIDEYLWIYGQWLEHLAGEPIRWIERAQKSHLGLLEKLQPPTTV